MISPSQKSIHRLETLPIVDCQLPIEVHRANRQSKIGNRQCFLRCHTFCQSIDMSNWLLC